MTTQWRMGSDISSRFGSTQSGNICLLLLRLVISRMRKNIMWIHVIAIKNPNCILILSTIIFKRRFVKISQKSCIWQISCCFFKLNLLKILLFWFRLVSFFRNFIGQNLGFRLTFEQQFSLATCSEAFYLGLNNRVSFSFEVCWIFGSEGVLMTGRLSRLSFWIGFGWCFSEYCPL